MVDEEKCTILPDNIKKISAFLMFSRGIVKVHWPEMGLML